MITGAVRTAGALAEAVVDLAAVAHNTAVVAQAAGTPVMAVVKADGFGHGAVPVARAALGAGATWLGVASGAEALSLRAAGITAPVLSWLHGLDDDFAAVVAARVDLAAAGPEQLWAIAAGAARAGMPAQVHLKVDTGMSRGGALLADWPHLVSLARRLEADGLLRVRGVWSHLARADEPGNHSIATQVARFEEAVGYARAAGLDPPLRHLANSAAALGAPRTRYDLVRAGIALYGVEPLPGREHGLRPALTLRARAVLVKRTPPGTGVSYQHTYTTSAATTLVLVPLGYADGVPRAASNRAAVWIGGQRRPIAGVVSMDQFVVDAGNLPVQVGDEVVVFGPGDAGEPTVTDWARWLVTNPHEIFTGIGARVSRRYQGMPGQESHHAG